MPIEAMTYSSLLNDLRNYLDRGGGLDPIVAEQLPRFVMLAEARLAREAKGLATKNAVIGELVSGEAIVPKPLDWRETISFSVSDRADSVLFPRVFDVYKPLYYRSYEFVRLYWQEPLLRGVPNYYADYKYKFWLVGPTPDTNYPIEIIYYQRIPPLSEVSQTNIYTENYPDLLLYACLLESAPFLKADQRLQTWQNMYSQALASAVNEQKARQQDNAQQVET